MVARLNVPGSIYEAVQLMEAREISSTEISHSYAPVPGADRELEIQRYEFDRKAKSEISAAKEVDIPAGIRRGVRKVLHHFSPPLPAREADKLLRILWLNNERYVRLSPRGGWPASSGSSTREKATQGSSSTWRNPRSRTSRSGRRCGSCSPWRTRRRGTFSPRSWRYSTAWTSGSGAPIR